MKILHLADLHLGQRHNDSQVRFDDFFSSFQQTIDLAVDQGVELVILAGDLFDKPNISALTLEKTIQVFQKIKDKNIRVVAIEGNHDRPNIIDKFSFLDYLNSNGYLDLLKVSFDQQKKLVVDKFSTGNRTGGYLEFPEFRIVGVGYWSKVLEEKITDLKEQLINIKEKEGDKFTILMLHGAVGKGIIGGISKENIELLKEEVDYLALGHWHRKQEEDGWIFNPGSLEHTDINEQDITKGAFIIELKKSKQFEYQFLDTPKRELLRFKIDCNGLNNTAEVYKKIAVEMLQYNISIQEPMVKVTLRGKVNFNPLEINNKEILELLNKQLGDSEEKEITSPNENLFSDLDVETKLQNVPAPSKKILFLEVNNLLNIEETEFAGKVTDSNFNVKALEESIMADIVSNSSKYQENKEDIVEISKRFKEMILDDYEVEEVLKILERE